MLRSLTLVGAAALFFKLDADAAATDSPVVQAGMVVGQLRVAPASGRNALIGIGNDVDQFQMGIDSSGSFIIASPRSTILSVDDEDTMHIHANLSTSSLDLQGPLTVRGVPQFRTTHREDFTSGSAEGWDNPASHEIVSSCAGISMLGGYGKFAKGEISKVFKQLPPHNELRVKAVFHFIDAWVGETGFMRLDTGADGGLAYAWTERHSQDFEQNAVNACGGPVGEGKFSTPIEVVVPHDKDSVTVSFGSTIETDDPFDQSWGVSAIEIAVR
ncbi:uncharacterized protein LOC34622774 [Cyclospora cayetanensis]|uniref:Uncharacterized protein LOC34622774 n=1 Tax=Cyclospora cayetanensis TaxID=88456 RepID=A0A6P6RQW6_9EIME|nr:uncharacterized protein LOC34622774 [Cyclospora cayetanensis]